MVVVGLFCEELRPLTLPVGLPVYLRCRGVGAPAGAGAARPLWFAAGIALIFGV